jgi:hypothetical protein
MKIAFVILSVLLIASCVSAPGVQHHSAGSVILPEASTWAPSAEEMSAFEAKLGAALAKEDLKLEDYYLRASAVTRSNTRMIEGLGARKDEVQRAEFLASNDIVILAFGGGSGYFKFSYDAERRRIKKCTVNAAL